MKNNLKNLFIRKDLHKVHRYHWEPEHAGLGTAFRAIYNYPSFFPFYFKSDHGILWGSKIFKNETDNESNIYFTWNYKKYKKLKKKKVIAFYIQNPVIEYKNKYLDNRDVKKRNGTIVFFPHENKNIRLKFNKKLFFLKLKKLDKKFHPISICINQHSYNDNLIKFIKKYNFKIVSAGNLESRFFVKNFYEMISKFKFATSPIIPWLGTNFFYCVEDKLPYFFINQKAEFFYKKSKKKRDTSSYGDKNEIKEYKKIVKIFSKRTVTVTSYQKKIVDSYIGKNSKTSKLVCIFFIYYSFVKNIKHYIKNYVFPYFKIRG